MAAEVRREDSGKNSNEKEELLKSCLDGKDQFHDAQADDVLCLLMSKMFNEVYDETSVTSEYRHEIDTEMLKEPTVPEGSKIPAHYIAVELMTSAILAPKLEEGKEVGNFRQCREQAVHTPIPSTKFGVAMYHLNPTSGGKEERRQRELSRPIGSFKFE